MFQFKANSIIVYWIFILLFLNNKKIFNFLLINKWIIDLNQNKPEFDLSRDLILFSFAFHYFQAQCNKENGQKLIDFHVKNLHEKLIQIEINKYLTIIYYKFFLWNLNSFSVIF